MVLVHALTGSTPGAMNYKTSGKSTRLCRNCASQVVNEALRCVGVTDLNQLLEAAVC